MLGQAISHYHILEKLGEGGMGVVYKAQDTKLNRTVALKFLPDHISSSEKDSARFLQEAQAAAALNHPNICTIYGIEESDGRNFIVMEFVDGQTLQDKKSSVSMKQALDIGIQIAEGLAAAHEKGVIHRDIKPENIMIRKDGIAQVMDFGLAKLRGASRLTKEGSTVGTAGYMSPEQVQGQETDHRSDIFSLGVLLYEMLTGRIPFKGVHETAIAYEIVNVDSPPMSSIKPEIPQELDVIVLECLEKDPNERAQSAKQVAIDLKRQKRESSRSRFSRTVPARQFEPPASGPAAAQNHPFPSFRKLAWPLATALLVIALTISIWSPWRAQKVSHPVMRFSVDLPQDGLMGFNTSSLDLSPDGKFIAYSGGTGAATQIFLRPTNQLQVYPLAGTAGAIYPAFSPDGQWIAYEVNGTLMKISVFGGAPQKLCDTRGVSRGIGWIDDATVVFGHINRGILRVAAAGGEPEPVSTLDSTNGEISHRFPQILPDGNTILYTVKQNNISSFDEAAIVAQRLDTGERKVLVRGGSYGRYVPTGHLMYVRGGSIFAVPFDQSTLTLLGQPIAIEKGGWMNRGSGDGYFAFSRQGTFVFSPADPPNADNVFISWIDRNGTIRPLIDSARSFYIATISPDGQKLATNIQAANDDIWIYHLQRKTMTRFTFGGGNFANPIWSPDGKEIAYISERGTAVDIFKKPWDGSGAEERLTNGLGVSYASSFTPDGKNIAFVQNGDIWVLPLDGDRVPVPFIQSPASEGFPMFSPDGRWMAYSSNESGRDEVYVIPYPKRAGKYQISSGGGTYPLWTSGGKELCYVSGSMIKGVTITGTEPFDYSAERTIVKLPPSAFLSDDAPIGSQFIIGVYRSQAVAQSELTVVLEWFEDLKTKTSGMNTGATR